LDTKLKKSRPFAAWLCMFLAFVILLAAVCVIPLFDRDALAPNYTRTDEFTFQLNYALQRMTGTVPLDAESEKDAVFYDEYNGKWLTPSEHDQWYMDSNGYQYFFRRGDKFATNMGVTSVYDACNFADSPYDFALIKVDYFYRGSSMGVEFPNLPIDQISRIDYGYSSELAQYCRASLYIADELAGEDFDFVLLVPAVEKGGLLNIVAEELFGVSGYAYTNHTYIYWVGMRTMLVVWCCAVLLGIFFLIMSIIKRRSIGLFCQKLARLQSKLLFEIKLALFFLLLVLPMCFFISEIDWNPFAFTITAISLQLFFLIWMAYSDFKYNGAKIFSFNIVSLIIKYLKNRDGMYPFQKRMMRIVRRTFIFSYLLIIPGCMIAFLAAGWHMFFLFLFGLFLLYLGILILTFGFDRYRTLTLSLGELVSQTQAIRAGELGVKPNKITNGDISELAENINCIQDGLKSAVAKQTSSERMKVELITNVSHDLKTPLTSMTNYLGLLEREKLEPPEANDYVAVLSQKTKRLTSLVNDLFDVSKASSGAMELKTEPLDIVSLTEQTLAELEERITAAGVAIKLNHPAEKLWVMGDGGKLYRVFENIIGNAVKYSLAGTRIYIDISKGKNMVCMTVKNIANYEMDFDPNEMLERFVRADKSRTAEGSGLGLSIAKSFTELQGGKLNLSVDGDLFKVTVALCAAQAPASQTQPDIIDVPDQATPEA